VLLAICLFFAIKKAKLEIEIQYQRKKLIGNIPESEIKNNYYFENNIFDGVPNVKMYEKTKS
jgi:hypothetical protein